MGSRRQLALPALFALVIPGLVAWVAVRPSISSQPASHAPDGANTASSATRIDALLATRWSRDNVAPADPADELQVLRRLSFALVGAPPSLEEIRQFELDRSPDRLQRWTSRLIADSRFVEYFAARLGDALVDPVEETLKPHQRTRFSQWLGRSLQRGVAYSEIADRMIAGQGGIADHPANTFVAVELSLGDQAAERLAARTSRAFLGQRIDCAQCHDHPFADWTQPQFESLAAFYGQVRFRHARLQDNRNGPFVIKDDRLQQERTVEPEVPFSPQWVDDNQHLRKRLAGWVTHPDNRRFRRAIANRVWGLIFGRALIAPVDDLPDPGDGSVEAEILDLLADDLLAHGDDLRSMIRVIAATRAFGLSSTHPALADESTAARIEAMWAAFPVTELGPQQMIRALQQSAAVETLRAETANSLTAIRRFERRHRFVEDYGVAGDTEQAQAATIPHTVERLSGNFTRQYSRASLLTAPGRIALMTGDAEVCLENCYLACLSRRPTPEERNHFLPQLSGNLQQRSRAIEDIYWTLFNSPEFCWNH